MKPESIEYKRLTIRTEKGAALIIEADNEEDAKKELIQMYPVAIERLAELEDRQTPSRPGMEITQIAAEAHYYCPRCGKRLFQVRNGHNFNPKYCEICGQAIDWY